MHRRRPLFSRSIHRPTLCLVAALGLPPVLGFASEVQCAISGIELNFDPINPFEGAPQNGQGAVWVVCTNPTAEQQQVSLVAFDPAPLTETLHHEKLKRAQIQLELFHDAGKKHKLGNSAQAPFALRAQHSIAAAAESVVKLPFHAQLTVGQRAPAGAYRRDMTLTLVYQ